MRVQCLMLLTLQHLPCELGGTQNTDIETWVMIQQHVDNFTHRYLRAHRQTYIQTDRQTEKQTK